MTPKKIILIITLVIATLGLSYYLFLSKSKSKDLVLYGNVDIRDVNLAFRVNGRLMTLKVDEGDEVHKGELIASLDPQPYEDELASAKAVVNQQKAALAFAEVVFAREKKLFGTGASSTDNYQNALTSLHASQAALDKALADVSQAALRVQDCQLYSPSNGVVLIRAVEPGTMLAAGAAVLDVSLVDPVWVRAYVAEPELGRAKQGTQVKVYSDSDPNKAYEGTIGFVSPTAEFTPKTVETTDLRTELVYRLRIIMHDPKHELRQGMPVTVVLSE